MAFLFLNFLNGLPTLTKNLNGQKLNFLYIHSSTLFTMTIKRRNFLKTAGGFAAGIAFTPYACSNSGSTETSNQMTKTFGLQLYTLRDDFPRDPKGVLAKVASYGYKQIEGYEADRGLFWGMTNKELKAYMDELDMKLVSSHCDIDNDFERKAAEAAEIGMEYLICPWRMQQSLDDYYAVAEDFNAKGEICKQNGIKFAYHNHAYTFTEMDGKMPHDLLMDNTDPSLVEHEMDIYWVVTAGQDPIEWIKKYPNRFTLSHMKDRMKGTDEAEATCTLGTGLIDFPSIVKAGRANGMKHFIVEQERYEGTTPLQSAEDNAAYMSTLNI